jgi:hypothetical protein
MRVVHRRHVYPDVYARIHIQINTCVCNSLLSVQICILLPANVMCVLELHRGECFYERTFYICLQKFFFGPMMSKVSRFLSALICQFRSYQKCTFINLKKLGENINMATDLICFYQEMRILLPEAPGKCLT